MKRILLILSLFLAGYVPAQKLCDLTTSSQSNASDYLVKTDANCATGGSKKVTVANFIAGYGIVTSALNSGYIPYATGATTLADGLLYQSGNGLSIGSSSSSSVRLYITGTGNTSGTHTAIFQNLAGNHLAEFRNDLKLIIGTSGNPATLQYYDGSQGAGKILQSDASGVASWVTPSSIGTGTTNYVAKWTSSTVLGNSLFYDDGTDTYIKGSNTGLLFDKESSHHISIPQSTTSNTAGGNFYFEPAASSGSAVGGSFVVSAGYGGSTGNGGGIYLTSGLSGTSTNSNGTGPVEIASNTSSDASYSGYVKLITGATNTNYSGDISLLTGNSTTNNSGSIILQPGTSGATRGKIKLVTSTPTSGYVFTCTNADGTGVWSAPATSGTVTSVGFTGGLISVATATTTPAFTVAGTSGGIPYFSSSSTWASSAALAANALLIGGGAGAAPSSITTGSGVLTALGINTGSAGAFVVNGGALGTPSSGVATNLTGTASGLTAGNVTTNANLTGEITSVGNAAVLGSFTSASLSGALTNETGSGLAVFATSPTFTTPLLGTPTSGTLTNCTGLPVAGGGSGNSTFTAYSVITAGTTSTGAFQNVSGVGTSGQVLTSNGAAALPTWQAASGGGLTVGTTTVSSGTDKYFLYNNAGVLGNYAVTGSGTTGVLSTTPTFNTNITSPLVIGGTGTGSSLTLQSTSGVGATDMIKFLVGNNGGTEAMRIFDDGRISIGTSSELNGLFVTNGSAFPIGCSSSLSTTTMGTGTAAISVANTSATAGNRAGIGFTTSNNDNPYAGIDAVFVNASRSNPSTRLDLFTASSGTRALVLRMDESANVGIGTTTIGEKLTVLGNISLASAGNTVKVKAGTNACRGHGTLSGGTLTVSTTCATANTYDVFVSDAGGTITNLGALSVTASTAATSFVITSANVLDASTVTWWIVPEQ